MRDLKGRLERLAEFVAEGRITVDYALERAVALSYDEVSQLDTDTLLQVAATAREREQLRCERIITEQWPAWQTKSLLEAIRGTSDTDPEVHKP